MDFDEHDDDEDGHHSLQCAVEDAFILTAWLLVIIGGISAGLVILSENPHHLTP